jgi:RND family efflux transporter MFP subunit
MGTTRPNESEPVGRDDLKLEGASQMLPGRIAAITFMTVTAMTLAGCKDDVAEGGSGPPPPKVAIAAAYSEIIVDEAVFIGKGEAVDSVDLVARVDGFLQEATVADGSEVSAGDVLYRIERQSYAAAVAARQADRARAEANLDLARIELGRKQTLVDRGATAQSELDVALANVKAAEADVMAAGAALEQAELNLSYTVILAPFDGRIGRASVSIGEVVGPTRGPLVSLVRESPVYVTFSLGEKQLVSVLQNLNASVRDLNDGSRSPEVIVELPNGSMLEETGRIVFAGNRIDPATGTIPVRAEFANEKGLIVDGSFLKVRIKATEGTERLLVPQAAVQRDQKGEFVLVVNQQQTVEQRYITIGKQTDIAFIVTDGLQEGESVIVEGLQRVRPGVPVEAILASQGGGN